MRQAILQWNRVNPAVLTVGRKAKFHCVTDNVLLLLHFERILIFFNLLGENNDDTAGLAPSAVIPGLYFSLGLPLM